MTHSDRTRSARAALAGAAALAALVRDDDNLAGFIGGYDFDMDFTAIENPHKSENHYPDDHIEARSPAGVLIRMGSIRKAKSERTGTEYLSIAFSSPRGTQHRANGLRREDAPSGEYEIEDFTDPDLASQPDPDPNQNTKAAPRGAALFRA